MRASSQTYSLVAIFLHWLIALLIIAQLVGGKYMVSLGFSGLKFELFQLHKSFGILILVLSCLRLVWRLSHTPPALPQGMSTVERVAAKFTHILFYVLIIGVPILGWAMVSASPTNIPTTLFKVIPWPHIPGIETSEVLTAQFKSLHAQSSYIFIGLIILHIGAALKHHFVNKDTVLVRMAPFLKPKG